MTTTRVLKQHDKVKDAFDKYTNALDKTNERRELWKTETKEKIIEILTLVQNTFKFDWHVQRLDSAINYQTINISCYAKNSGIVENIIDEATGNLKKTKAYKKYGGYLAFCQSFNGKINVIIGYPYIEEWVSEMDAKVLATLEPSEITEEVISNLVVKFLENMSEWEGMERPPVGFKS